MQALADRGTRHLRLNGRRWIVALCARSPPACAELHHQSSITPASCRNTSEGARYTTKASGKGGSNNSGQSKGKGKSKGKRRQPPPASSRPWADEVHTEGAAGDRPYGSGPRHARVDIEFEELARNKAAVQETLRWHREGTQRDHLDEDVLLPSQRSASMRHDEGPHIIEHDHWWTEWESEWDEGWDWECKWHPEPGATLAPRDDPRRPKGPLVSITRGGYKPVAALNHSEVTAAIVAAHSDPPGEVVWQALCRRAELVAISLTPAEVLAVVRCVSDRQASQLRLLWKLAGLVVEKLAAFTAEDMVAFASAYASLDAIHHGLLNVTALVLADPHDDRELTPTLAIEVLAAFAKAKYPLPLIIDETKRVIRSAACEHGLATIPPAAALNALDSFTELAALDATTLSVLLPLALASSKGQGSGQAQYRFPAACAVCNWVVRRLDALRQLQCIEAGDMSGETAIANTLQVSLDVLHGLDLRRIRVQRAPVPAFGVNVMTEARAVRCVIPIAHNRRNEIPAAGGVLIVPGEELLALAELMTEPRVSAAVANVAIHSANGSVKRERNINEIVPLGAILAGALRVGAAEMWPVNLQVRWLRVASNGFKTVHGSDACSLENTQHFEQATVTILNALQAQPPHELVPSASALAPLFPVLLDMDVDTKLLAAVAGAVAAELRPNLFRLDLHDAWTVSDGFLRFRAKLRNIPPPVETLAIVDEISALGRAMISSLPSKIRAERVFHRRPGAPEGVDSADLCRWCALVANFELWEAVGLPVAENCAASDELWSMLAEEARQVVAQGEPDGETVELLEAFVSEGNRRGWSAQDTESPLGVVAAAVLAEWQRNISCDGELEDAIHEPIPIEHTVASSLSGLLHGVGLSPPQ